MISLKDKVIFVAGGSTGIGRATSQILCKNGAKVIIGDTNKQEGENFSKEMSSEGMTVDFHLLDVTDLESVTNCLNQIINASQILL